MSTIEFKIELETCYMKHLKDKSHYNRNYYELDLRKYGDYIIPEKCNILYEEAEDDEYYAYYSLGYFEDGKFVACFTWLDDAKDFDGVWRQKNEKISK